MKNLQCTSMNEDVLKENNGYKYEFILSAVLYINVNYLDM